MTLPPTQRNGPVSAISDKIPETNLITATKTTTVDSTVDDKSTQPKALPAAQSTPPKIEEKERSSIQELKKVIAAAADEARSSKSLLLAAALSSASAKHESKEQCSSMHELNKTISDVSDETLMRPVGLPSSLSSLFNGQSYRHREPSTIIMTAADRFKSELS